MSQRSYNNKNLRRRIKKEKKLENSRRNQEATLLKHEIDPLKNTFCSRNSHVFWFLGIVLFLGSVATIVALNYNLEINIFAINKYKNPQSSTNTDKIHSDKDNPEKSHDEKIDKFKRKTEESIPPSELSDNLYKYPQIAGIIQILGNDTEFGCHGTFVDFSPYIQNAVLITAAHCNKNDENSTIHQIYFHDQNQKKTVIKNSDEFYVISHPKFKFDDHEFGYDVSLIIFKNLRVTESARLPEAGEKLPDKFLRFEIIKNGNKYRSRIEEAEVKKINWKDCVKISFEYKKFEQSDRFCADNGAYTPTGNSGAGIFTWNGEHYVIYGVYSEGGTKNHTRPDIYMKMKSLDKMFESFDLNEVGKKLRLK
ncbi:unnamed protein product [Chironomus riparius]|uniref:Peptidase S1 domain-containing protein n=1 Tax=Chironomus riparius TaxID=315576 RepID=A0A9N9WZX1_9DIPT|nr:unnamed protein product [Chironomus riparius]